MSKNYEYYLKVGNYEEAYAKAKTDEEKQIVIAQNSIDFINRVIFSSEVLIDQMYLEKAWYDIETNCFLLAYRDIDDNILYKYFNYNAENKKYTISASAINDITTSTIELPKDVESAMRESEYGTLGIYTLKSMVLEILEEMMNDKNLIKSESIENINNFVRKRNFEDIPLLIIE